MPPVADPPEVDVVPEAPEAGCEVVPVDVPEDDVVLVPPDAADPPLEVVPAPPAGL